ncbi:MAG: SLC13 family permease [Rhodospirillales bacterium]
MPALRIPVLIAVATVACAIAAVAAGPPGDVSVTAWRAGAVCFTAAALWATAVMPEYVTALCLFFLLMVLGLAPAATVFSGFHSGAAWMVFGGLVIGAAVVGTGLAERIAHRLDRWLRGTYLRMLYALTALTAGLGFFLPSANSRVLILLPITLELARRAGLGAGSTGRTGLCLAVAATTIYQSAPIMTSGVPNLVLLGAAESIFGIHFRYGEWLVLHFPVLGVAGILGLPLIVRLLFPAAATADAAPATPPTPLTGGQRRLAVYLTAALALWATDTLHGIAPSWIALGVAILCIAPRAGVIPAAGLMQQINLSAWIYVCGIVGMGAVVTQTGLGDALGRALLAALPLDRGADFANFAIVAAIGMVLALVSGTPGLPAIMSPLAPSIAEATGWPLATVLMAQMPSCMMALFPYQFTPMVLAIALAKLPIAAAARLMIAYTAFAWVVLVPLQYLWWRALGMFG